MLILGALFGTWLYAGVWPLAAPRPAVGMGLWIFCGVAGLLGLTGTRAGLPIYWLRMLLACAIGAVVSPVVFALFFYLVITPIGLFMRLVGRDRLQLRRPAGETLWRDVPPITDRRRYHRQF